MIPLATLTAHWTLLDDDTGVHYYSDHHLAYYLVYTATCMRVESLEYPYGDDGVRWLAGTR